MVRVCSPSAAVIEPETNERGSSPIGRKTHFSSKSKELWSKGQGIVVMCEFFISLLVSFTLSRKKKKKKSKSLNEKVQELSML